MTACYGVHMSNHREERHPYIVSWTVSKPVDWRDPSKGRVVVAEGVSKAEGDRLMSKREHVHAVSSPNRACPTCHAVGSIDRYGRCVAFGTGCGYVAPNSMAARAVAVAERVERGEFGPVES